MKNHSTNKNGSGGWTIAKVRYLTSSEEEHDEIMRSNGNNRSPGCNESSFYDRAAVARAQLKSNEFTVPNSRMPHNHSLVDRWIDLARRRERFPGQIDDLLESLGEIPPPEEPTERSFWIGALINPIPAMGVALEIRPALLTATKAETRIDIALDGITRSIRHMSVLEEEEEQDNQGKSSSSSSSKTKNKSNE